jgi:hypothetical protein
MEAAFAASENFFAPDKETAQRFQGAKKCGWSKEDRFRSQL